MQLLQVISKEKKNVENNIHSNCLLICFTQTTPSLSTEHNKGLLKYINHKGLTEGTEMKEKETTGEVK